MKIKSIFQHFIYGLILIGLNLLAVRLNSFIIRQVQLKRQVSYVKCFYTIGLILALYSLLINLFTRIDPVDPYLSLLLTGRPRPDGNLSWLVWLVIFGDTVIKLLAIGIKCIILITSSKLGCLFKRVRIFMIIFQTFDSPRLIDNISGSCFFLLGTLIFAEKYQSPERT